MRTFELHRDADATGVSGTGHVADGVQFDDGVCVLHWRGEHRTTTTHASMASVEAVHCHGGATRVLYVGAPYTRGLHDAQMDNLEGAPYASVGKSNTPDEWRAPAYVAPREHPHYLHGYAAAMRMPYPLSHSPGALPGPTVQE